jgi:flagellar biosynthesis protein FlhA
MAKITRNYMLEVLRPINEETIKEFRTMKQDRNGMKIVPTDIMRLEIGWGLIPLFDKNLSDNLLERIKVMRKSIEEETGISIPSIRIRDNSGLTDFGYSFYIRGKKLVNYEIKRNKYLCIDGGKVKNKINGKEIKDPVFGVPAILINKNQIKEAADAGYTIVDAPGIIMTNLEHLIKENIAKIFTYDGSKCLLKKVGETHPLLIADCLSKLKPLDLRSILTIILDANKNLLNIDLIIELVLFYFERGKNIENIARLILKDAMSTS